MIRPQPHAEEGLSRFDVRPAVGIPVTSPIQAIYRPEYQVVKSLMVNLSAGIQRTACKLYMQIVLSMLSIAKRVGLAVCRYWYAAFLLHVHEHIPSVCTPAVQMFRYSKLRYTFRKGRKVLYRQWYVDNRSYSKRSFS
jgi:hypothetical protein